MRLSLKRRARGPTSEEQRGPMFSSHQQMRKRGTETTSQELMAKTSVTLSVCYRNTERKGAREEGGNERERTGTFGREEIRHYISDNLRRPSVIGACYQREERGNNILLNERRFDVPRGNNTQPSVVTHSWTCGPFQLYSHAHYEPKLGRQHVLVWPTLFQVSLNTCEDIWMPLDIKTPTLSPSCLRCLVVEDG